MRTERFAVSGMSCAACSSRVDKAVSALPGVSEVAVNLLKKSMRVVFDETALSVDDIENAVERAGYRATCASAAGAAKAGEAAAAGSAARAVPSAASDDESAALRSRFLVSLVFSLPLMILAMGPMMGLPLPGFLAGPEKAMAMGLTQLLLTLPVLVLNRSFFRTGLRALASGAPNMDSLIAVGAGSAAILSLYTLYRLAYALGAADLERAQTLSGDLYFDSAAMILTLITLGRFFEARARGRTSEAIARLMELAPKRARRLKGAASEDGAPDGMTPHAREEEEVPVEELRPGDVLVVRSGESVPVDGVILEGNAFLDESAITGESLPQERKAGDTVTGATLAASGHFLMRATRVGEDSTLARIIQLVDEATSTKAPIARLADRVSGVFVPLVMGIAALAAGVWLLLGQDVEFAVSIGVAVLVISCPCALGLATPTAIMVGTGRGAASGILVKSAEAMERAGQVSAVLLDKTGTVTLGRPVVSDLCPAPDVDETTLLTLAASLEKASEHPLGAAIVAEAEARSLRLEAVRDFVQTPGRGVSGLVGGASPRTGRVLGGRRCFGGNAQMLADAGLTGAAADLLAKGEALAAAGKTPLYFVRDQRLLGLIAVADVIKPSSARAVSELLDMGLDVVMLTGDNARTAEAIRDQAGIPRVLAETLPADKERQVRSFQVSGERVIMVGDGINDAPALARADVGVAIGAGTEIAMESADIVLMRNDLMDVVGAIRLSRAVMRTIRQNLFWAFFYNVIGIPVAAGVFYSAFGWKLDPMLAAAAMSCSSVSVVSNALRLRFLKLRDSPPAPSEAPSIANPETVNPATTKSKEDQTMKKTVHIEGMSCNHCTSSVHKALSALPGVSNVVVDLAARAATLDADPSVSNDALSRCVVDLGFEVKGIEG